MCSKPIAMAETIQCSGRVIDALGFRSAVMMWGSEHFRSFPWRLTEDPYRILMAEVMLHRTQARQVVPVYGRFTERYVDVPGLARATKGELHNALHSLGLRWRTDLIHEMAARLLDDFGGQVPREKAHLVSLPGVSEYIAGAVRCFAWNLPEPLIDANTVRVVGRLFGLEVKDSSRRNPRFRNLIAALVHPIEPRAYNYSLLDLAHQVCAKGHPPACERCPVVEWCNHAISPMS